MKGPSDDLNRYVELAHPQHYVRRADGSIRRRVAKLRGKAAVKAAKRARQRNRRAVVQPIAA